MREVDEIRHNAHSPISTRTNGARLCDGPLATAIRENNEKRCAYDVRNANVRFRLSTCPGHVRTAERRCIFTTGGDGCVGLPAVSLRYHRCIRGITSTVHLFSLSSGWPLSGSCGSCWPSSCRIALFRLNLQPLPKTVRYGSTYKRNGISPHQSLVISKNPISLTSPGASVRGVRSTSWSLL